MKLRVVYDDRMIADPGQQEVEAMGWVASPSAGKPKLVAAALLESGLPVEFIMPEQATPADFKLAHDPDYVDDVLTLKADNGFGNRSPAVAESLPWTTGAMIAAARAATKETPVCALVSGFHHAGYSGWRELGYFCTFNGLAVTAAKLLDEGTVDKVCIIDCDQHWGNGTDNILMQLPNLRSRVGHMTFGKDFSRPEHAEEYLSWLGPNGLCAYLLHRWQPDLVIYQAGVDAHRNDPYGGVFDDVGLYERDLRAFRLFRSLGLPVAWNLAGGYQLSPDGSPDKVVQLHLASFRACRRAYEETPTSSINSCVD